MKIGRLIVILCQFVSIKHKMTVHSEDGPENDEYNPEDNETGITDPQNT